MKHTALVLLLANILAGCTSHTYASGRCPNMSGWREPGEIGHQRPAYFVTVNGDEVVTHTLWLGYRMTPAEVTDRQGLSELLTQVPLMNPSPMVILNAAPSADCAFVRAVRAEMNSKLECKSWQCGEGKGWYEMAGMPLVG